MRIALFSDFSLSQTTGISDSIRTLKRELKARGHAVKVFTPTNKNGDAQDDCVELPSIGVPGAPDFRLIVPFYVPKSVEEFQPDVLHTHTFGSVGQLALHTASRLKLPILGTQHTLPAEYAHYLHFDFSWTQEMLCAYAARYYEQCDLITTPSEAVADELREYKVTKDIRVISNPIETDQFKPLPNREALKKQWGIGKPVVLCFGRLAKEKNLEELFYAFAIAKKTVDAALIVIGDGTEKEVLQKKADELGIASDVRFLGQLKSEELVAAINATDVYAITSRSETQSMTMLQAMACELPIVAVDKGALPEIVSHEQNGFIVASGDTQSFAARLVELLQDPAKRSAFSHRGREYVLRYSPAAVATQMEDAYQSVCQIHSSPSSQLS